MKTIIFEESIRIIVCSEMLKQLININKFLFNYYKISNLWLIKLIVWVSSIDFFNFY